MKFEIWWSSCRNKGVPALLRRNKRWACIFLQILKEECIFLRDTGCWVTLSHRSITTQLEQITTESTAQLESLIQQASQAIVKSWWGLIECFYECSFASRLLFPDRQSLCLNSHVQSGARSQATRGYLVSWTPIKGLVKNKIKQYVNNRLLKK